MGRVLGRKRAPHVSTDPWLFLVASFGFLLGFCLFLKTTRGWPQSRAGTQPLLDIRSISPRQVPRYDASFPTWRCCFRAHFFCFGVSPGSCLENASRFQVMTVCLGILWMNEILHHLETMGNHGWLVFTGESTFQGVLGGAGFRPSTVPPGPLQRPPSCLLNGSNRDDFFLILRGVIHNCFGMGTRCWELFSSSASHLHSFALADEAVRGSQPLRFGLSNSQHLLSSTVVKGMTCGRLTKLPSGNGGYSPSPMSVADIISKF